MISTGTDPSTRDTALSQKAPNSAADCIAQKMRRIRMLRNPSVGVIGGGIPTRAMLTTSAPMATPRGNSEDKAVAVQPLMVAAPLSTMPPVALTCLLYAGVRGGNHPNVLRNCINSPTAKQLFSQLGITGPGDPIYPKSEMVRINGPVSTVGV